MVHFLNMVVEFVRKARRDFIAGRIISNGETLTELRRERAAMNEAGLHDPALDSEIDKRYSRSLRLRKKLQED